LIPQILEATTFEYKLCLVISWTITNINPCSICFLGHAIKYFVASVNFQKCKGNAQKMHLKLRSIKIVVELPIFGTILSRQNMWVATIIHLDHSSPLIKKLSPLQQVTPLDQETSLEFDYW
jgi:hypothetical protein